MGEGGGGGGLGRSLPPSGRRGFRPEPGMGEVEIWGRETMRMKMGVDAVDSVEANLQRARRGTELAGRIRFRR